MAYRIVYLQDTDMRTIIVASSETFECYPLTFASRHTFDNLQTAIEHARSLAKAHGKDYWPYDDADRVDFYYLD